MTAGRAFAGHPVDVATGEQFTAAHDIELDGVVPIIFRRVYNTTFLDRAPSVLGQGWVHNYEATLVRDLDGLLFEGHNGTRIPFDDVDGRFETTGRLLNAGESMELRREGDLLVVYHWHGLEEPVQRYIFSPEEAEGDRMRLVGREIPSGHGVVIAHDRHGRVATVTQKTEGRRLCFYYNDHGLLSELHLASARALATPTELVARYEYDEHRRLVAVYDAAGSAQRYAYDQAGRVTMERGRRGGAFLFQYDGQGRCIETVGEGGYQQRRFLYEAPARVTRVLDGVGRETLYSYNSLGQVETKLLPSGAVHATQFDNEGRIAAEVGPVGETTAYEYDDRGNLAKKTFANGGCQTYEYDDYHQPTRITDPDGAVWAFRYERGALVESTDPFGCVTKYERNAQNDLVGATTPRGNEISILTNETWTEESISDSYGRIVTRRLDLRLNPTEIVDAEQQVTRLAYDRRGWLVEQTLPDGTRRTFQHDAQGALVQSTDGRGAIRRVDLSPFGDPLEEVDPLGRTYRYSWDTEGRLVSIANPRGETTTFQYDSVGNCVATQHFDGSVERTAYDLAGRPIRRHRADGTLLELEHDAVGNLRWTRSGNRELQRFVYNAAGDVVEARSPDAVVRFEYVAGGRVVAEDQSGHRIDYEYGAAGGLMRRTLQGSKAGALWFEYDLRGRMARLCAESGGEQTFRYDGRNLPTERRMGAVLERRAFDGVGRIREQSILGTVLRSYRYDAEGSLVSIIDSLRGRRSHEYDLADQLVHTEVRRSDEPWARGGNVHRTAAGGAGGLGRGGEGRFGEGRFGEGRFGEGRFGEGRFGEGRFGEGRFGERRYEDGPQWRDHRDSTRGATTEHHYEYDVTGNLSARDLDRYLYTQGDRLERYGWRTLERNANGELVASTEREATTRYEWDPLGQLVKVVHPGGGETRFGYDAFGRRVYKIHGGITTRYLWSWDDLAAELTRRHTDPPGAQAAAPSASAGRTPPAADAARSPPSDEHITEYAIAGAWPLALWEDGAVRHVVTSHHGVPHELLDEIGRVVWKGEFDDWGRLVREEGTTTCRLRLLGQLEDAETGLHYNRYRYYLPEAGQFISPDPIGLLGGFNRVGLAPNAIGWADPLGLDCGKTDGSCPGITYFRVQGGTPPLASRHLVHVDGANNVTFSNSTLNLSVGNTEHAQHFLTNRPGAQIVSFRVPLWFHGLVMESAIPQQGYRSNPSNQGGLAPKIVDPRTPGLSIELPPIWSQWLNESVVPGSGNVL